jgi:cytochrome c556
VPSRSVTDMTSVRELLTDLEARVTYLEENAAPGRVDALGQTSVDSRRQIQALQEGLAEFRGEMADFRADMEEFRADAIADLTTLKADMTEVKGALREVLSRLPPPA